MPESRYETPHEQLLGLAQRARIRGWTFEKFWTEAIPPPRRFDSGGVSHVSYDQAGLPLPSRRLPQMADTEHPRDSVVWPNDTMDRQIAYSAALEAETFWRAAFEGRAPSNGEAALERLRTLSGP